LKSHIGGPIVFTTTLNSLSAYESGDDDMLEILHEQTFNEIPSYLYLDNIVRTKYGSIMTGLNTQQSLENNQYPKTISESNNVLSNHRLISHQNPRCCAGTTVKISRSRP
jgi:hypothetical protein